MKNVSILAILWALVIVADLAFIAFCFYVLANIDNVAFLTYL